MSFDKPLKFTLKELRARNNITQMDAAKATGVTIQTYNRWEQNPGTIPVSKFVILADYLKVDMSDIFLP